VAAEALSSRTSADPAWRPNRAVSNCKANPTTLRAAVGRAPWELSAEEFDNVCEPWFETTPGGPSSHRMFGLSVSHLRFGLRLRLVVLGGPEGGYVAEVDWSDEASLNDPRRAFIQEALTSGQRVPAHVLADYPDLQPQS
jgi:hypothetical protein